MFYGFGDCVVCVCERQRESYEALVIYHSFQGNLKYSPLRLSPQKQLLHMLMLHIISKWVGEQRSLKVHILLPFLKEPRDYLLATQKERKGSEDEKKQKFGNFLFLRAFSSSSADDGPLLSYVTGQKY